MTESFLVYQELQTLSTMGKGPTNEVVGGFDDKVCKRENFNHVEKREEESE